MQLTNASIGASEIEWWVDGNLYSTENIISLPAQNDSLFIFLIATNEENCSDTTWLTFSDLNWGIANIITPNHDGTNDFFVFNFDLGPCIDLIVYNRWGTVIYENSNYQNDWNGENKSGKEISDGTYFYIVNLCDYAQVAGYITIMH